MLMPLYPDNIVSGEERTDLLPLVHQQILTANPLHDLLPRLAVLGTDQSVMAGHDDVLHLLPVPVHHVADPPEGDRKVTILQKDDQDIFTDHIVVMVLGSAHMDRIFRNKPFHRVDPLYSIGMARLVIAHQRQKLYPGFAIG